jgi:hypothetical protein
MNYVYIRSEPGLYTVGFYDPAGKWHADSDFPTPQEAADHTAYLNGAAGKSDPTLEKVARQLKRIADALETLANKAVQS